MLSCIKYLESRLIFKFPQVGFKIPLGQVKRALTLLEIVFESLPWLRYHEAFKLGYSYSWKFRKTLRYYKDIGSIEGVKF